MRSKLGSLLLAFALLLTISTPASAGGGSDEAKSEKGSESTYEKRSKHKKHRQVRRELANIRRVTAKYRDIEVAIEDGYELGYNDLVTGCIAHPTDGAMGYHYFNAELFEDPDVDPLRPEGLLYEPDRNGKLRLVAVEWVVPSEVWETTGDPNPPSVLDIDLHVLNPALGWYIHHAWIFKHNPSGVFSDWNPKVDCPTE